MNLLNRIRTAYRRLFPPRRRVVDPEEPVLKYHEGEVLTTHRARLACGHRLACDSTRTKWRRCFMCAKGLPTGRRVRVRPGQRKAVTA